MYDELVKRLRDLASIPEHCENVESCDKCSKEDVCLSFTNARIIKTATEAADAIEELSKYADAIGKLKCEGWYLQQTKYHDGYHAVATRPLPEPPKEGEA